MQVEYSIFYTDDDRDDQAMFRDAVAELTNNSVQLFTQDNGDELIGVLKNPPPTPKLIFLDLNMPIKNGYDVLQEIRSADATRDLPVVIFSTSDDRNAITKSRKLGANLYVTKPDSYKLLKKAVQHVLSVDWTTFTPGDKDFVYTSN